MSLIKIQRTTEMGTVGLDTSRVGHSEVRVHSDWVTLRGEVLPAVGYFLSWVLLSWWGTLRWGSG